MDFTTILNLAAPLIVILLTQLSKKLIATKWSPLVVLVLGGISALISVGPAPGEGFLTGTLNVAFVSGGAAILYDLFKKLKGTKPDQALKSILVLFLLAGFVSGCAGLKAQWSSLPSDDKARIIVDDMQSQLNTAFDTADAYVKANPQYAEKWQKEILPAFDVANKAIKTSIDLAKAGKITYDDVLADARPLFNAVISLLQSIGVKLPLPAQSAGPKILPVSRAIFPIEAGMDAGMILILINGLMSLVFNLWSSARKIYGEEAIPTWEDITNKNKQLQDKIDAAKQGGSEQ
jgi:hypothetical protein